MEGRVRVKPPRPTGYPCPTLSLTTLPPLLQGPSHCQRVNMSTEFFCPVSLGPIPRPDNSSKGDAKQLPQAQPKAAQPFPSLCPNLTAQRHGHELHLKFGGTHCYATSCCQRTLASSLGLMLLSGSLLPGLCDHILSACVISR